MMNHNESGLIIDYPIPKPNQPKFKPIIILNENPNQKLYSARC